MNLFNDEDLLTDGFLFLLSYNYSDDLDLCIFLTILNRSDESDEDSFEDFPLSLFSTETDKISLSDDFNSWDICLSLLITGWLYWDVLKDLRSSIISYLKRLASIVFFPILERPLSI